MLSEDQFDKGLAKLASAFPDHKLSEASYEVYRERICSKVQPHEWEAAVNYLIDTGKFFPKIAEVFGAVRLLRPSAIDAWNYLLRAAEDGEKPKLDRPTEAALLAVGGWENFSTMDYDSLKFLFKTFKEIYLTSQEMESYPLLGRGEIAMTKLEGPSEG